MDRIVKRFFHKGKVIQDDDAKSFNQGQTASEENQYAAPIYLRCLNLPLVTTLRLTLRRTGFKDDYGIKVLCSPDQPRAEYAFLMPTLKVLSDRTASSLCMA